MIIDKVGQNVVTRVVSINSNSPYHAVYGGPSPLEKLFTQAVDETLLELKEEIDKDIINEISSRIHRE